MRYFAAGQRLGWNLAALHMGMRDPVYCDRKATSKWKILKMAMCWSIDAWDRSPFARLMFLMRF